MRVKKDQCHLLGMKLPSRIQQCIGIRLFSLIMCIIIAIQGTYLGYIVGVLTNIEKRFQISSSMSGAMLSMYDIGHTLSVLLVGYFYADRHKPKVIAGGVLLSSLSMLLLALPNFIFGPTSYPATEQIVDHYLNGTFGCQSEANQTVDWCPKKAHGGAYAILVVAQLLAGVAAAPFNTIAYIYIDDNVSHRESPLYLGFLTGMYAFGPAFGFLLSAFCTNLYVSLNAVQKPQPNSHYWISAWWLGFLICAVLYIVFSVPLFFFPKKLSKRGKGAEAIQMHSNCAEGAEDELIVDSEEMTVKCRLIIETAKALPSAAWTLLKNPVYSSMVLGWIFGSYLIGGYGTYLPKFIEIQFEQTASMADIYSGLISIGSVAVSTALGGYLLSRFNIQPRLATLLLIITWTIIFFTYLLGIAFGCDQVSLKGVQLADSGQWNFSTPCSRQCHCDDSIKFMPVCDGSVTYFSPCHAGCTFEGSNNTWLDCKCAENGSAVVEGFCKTGCTALTMYIATMFVGLFLGNLFFMSTMTVVLRSVEVEERSLALSLASFLTNILGFIPSPIIFGMIIDSTCLAWHSSCHESGNCVLYDNMAFRYKYHSGNAGFQLAAILVTVFTYYKQGRFVYPSQDNLDDCDEKEETTEPFTNNTSKIM